MILKYLRLRLSDSVVLEAAGGHQRALRLIGVNIDEADMHAGKGLAALHVDRVMNDALAVGQVAYVHAVEGAGNLDVFYSVIIAVAERERHQRFRPQPAPAPGLR